jgi:hypothetical protein
MDKVDSNDDLKIGNTLYPLCADFLIVKVRTTRLDCYPVVRLCDTAHYETLA